MDSHYEVKTSILESSLVQVLNVSLSELHVWFRVAIQVCVVANVLPSNVQLKFPSLEYLADVKFTEKERERIITIVACTEHLFLCHVHAYDMSSLPDQFAKDEAV